MGSDEKRPNLVTSYGLFWDLHETEWHKRDGRGPKGRMLGKLGSHIADFYYQPGIYVLYGNLGVYYAGIAPKAGLGKRISQHRTDAHGDKWHHFSWFSFGEVQTIAGHQAVVGERPFPTREVRLTRAAADIEAILHRAFQFRGNPAGFGVRAGESHKVGHWSQVSWGDVPKALERARGRSRQ